MLGKGEHVIATDCPVCGARKYVKDGEKLVCCPEPKKGKTKDKPADVPEKPEDAKE